jgi:hypothetical protein
MDWLLLALLAVLVGSVGFTLGAWWGAPPCGLRLASCQG